MKRPKRKAPGASPIKKPKSESPSLDEEDEDRFAFSVTKEGAEEYQYSGQYTQPQQQQQHHQHHPQTIANKSNGAPQQSQMVVDSRSQGLPVPTETHSGTDTPCTPQFESAPMSGYPGETWNEVDGNMLGQQMMQGHMYPATGLILGQPAEGYMQQQQQQQQQQQTHYHHAPPSQQPQSHMPAAYAHQQPIRHEYSHNHMHYSHPPHPSAGGYTGYQNVENNARPHLVIDAGMNGAGNQGSQPTSAVAMSADPNAFYSHQGSMPVQSIAPSALYAQPTQQEQYATQGWNPTQDYYRQY